MKHVKIFGSLAVMTTVLMVCTGTAVATITVEPVVGNMHLTSSNTTIHGGPATTECKSATTTISLANGVTSGTVTAYDISECEPDTVAVKAKGTLSIASNGAVTSNEAEITVVVHRAVFGFPITAHCIYKTANTSVGTLTEGVYPPAVHIGSSPLPRVTTDAACGEASVMTGSYTVTEPEGVLTVD